MLKGNNEYAILTFNGLYFGKINENYEFEENKNEVYL
jgi:hypothetical protein